MNRQFNQNNINVFNVAQIEEDYMLWVGNTNILFYIIETLIIYYNIILSEFWKYIIINFTNHKI